MEIEQNIIYEDTLLEITPELMKKTIVKQDKEIERLQNIINELETYIDKMSYAPVVNNPKKDLAKILKRVDKE